MSRCAPYKSPREREARNAKGNLISSSLPEPGRHVFLAHAVALKEEPQRKGCVSHTVTNILKSWDYDTQGEACLKRDCCAGPQVCASEV